MLYPLTILCELSIYQIVYKCSLKVIMKTVKYSHFFEKIGYKRKLITRRALPACYT